MAEKIIMPKTGMAMEEGIVVEWLVKEGDGVEKGDPVAVIETDKAAMDLESDYDGTILKILYPALSTVPVVETIAWIGKPGEKVPDAPPPSPKVEGKTALSAKAETPDEVQTELEVNSIDERIKATPAARKAAEKKNITLKGITPKGKSGEIRERDVLAVDGKTATPLAARIAADENINISAISGSGLRGKILKSDLSAGSLH